MTPADAWGALLTAAAVLAAAWAVLRKAAPITRKLVHLIDDFNGEPPDPERGLPKGRPGIMARLAGIEDAARGTTGRLERIERDVAEVRTEQSAQRIELGTLTARVEHIDRLITTSKGNP